MNYWLLLNERSYYITEATQRWWPVFCTWHLVIHLQVIVTTGSIKAQGPDTRYNIRYYNHVGLPTQGSKTAMSEYEGLSIIRRMALQPYAWRKQKPHMDVPTTDLELLVKTARGNTQNTTERHRAFSILVQRFQDMVFGYSYSILAISISRKMPPRNRFLWPISSWIIFKRLKHFRAG